VSSAYFLLVEGLTFALAWYYDSLESVSASVSKNEILAFIGATFVFFLINLFLL
jgi:hypothetical protein